MRYVFPRNPEIDGWLNEQCLPRLCAYPHRPTNSGFCILDSGAFGLSLKNEKMDMDYMENLSGHYEEYGGDNRVCVAPDEFLNPRQSMMNLVRWQSAGLYSNVAAVIQSSTNRRVDIDELKQQVDFYASRGITTMLFSNNGLRGEDAKAQQLHRLFDYMERKSKYIHVLGAGWSINDIHAWQKVGGFDSMDSIAPYTCPADYGAQTAKEAVERILACFKI